MRVIIFHHDLVSSFLEVCLSFRFLCFTSIYFYMNKLGAWTLKWAFSRLWSSLWIMAQHARVLIVPSDTAMSNRTVGAHHLIGRCFSHSALMKSMLFWMHAAPQHAHVHRTAKIGARINNMHVHICTSMPLARWAGATRCATMGIFFSSSNPLDRCTTVGREQLFIARRCILFWTATCC